MELNRRFALIQEEVTKLQVPKSVRDHISSRIEYFRRQSLCDFDRRHSDNVIAANWAEFLGEIRGVKLLEKFRSDRTFWTPIALFVRDPAFSVSLPTPRRPIFSPYKTWNLESLLKYLRDEIPRLEATQEEKRILMLTVLVFHYQADRPRWKQDHETLKAVWLESKPLFVKYRLLAPFKDEPHVMSALRTLVTNNCF